jgi:hypothetical protein
MIPTWEEIEKKRNRKQKLNPIEQFIYDYEPAGEDKTFRKKFIKALIYAGEE